MENWLTLFSGHPQKRHSSKRTGKFLGNTQRKCTRNRQNQDSRGTNFNRNFYMDFTPTSTCIIDVEEFVKQAKEYANIVTPTGLIINIPDLKSAENRIISVFVVDKKLKLQKGYIMESPADTGINIQLIVRGKNLPICDILLAIQEECVALIKKIFKIRRVCSE